MSKPMSKKLRDSIRYTLAYYAGNVALIEACPVRLKENLSFLRDYIRRGLARDALGCMVENIFLGDDVNELRYAAVIRWYDRKHPGSAALIVSYLDEMADVSLASGTVGRIRRRLHVQPIGLHKKPENRLKKIVGR